MSTDDKTRIVSASEAVGPGTQLNGIFEIDEHIAFGGMGEVYRGHNIQTDDPVAIKIVLPEFARDKTMLALFRKEASILSHLANDAIVRYYVFTIDPAIGRPYLAMEYVDGVSLADVIARGPMEAGTVRRLVARIASGLSAAHAAGVVHRDLSPDNVILPGGKVEKAKIIDFGIAKSANVGGGTLLGGKFAGKYNFVSPEQLGDFGGEITGRSDIYSLGLLMAAVLRGEAIDMGGSQVDVIEKRRRMPDISDLDAGLRPLLESMLQPDPDNRPESMDAVVEQLAGSKPAAVSAPSLTEPLPGDDPAWQGLPVPGEKSLLPRATTPPLGGTHRPGSLGPTAVAASGGSAPPAAAFPLGGSIPPIGSVPPLQPGSVPPVSESPFGAYQPPVEPARPPALGRAAAPAPKSRAWLYATAAVVLVALAGGGAYTLGVLDGWVGQDTDSPPAPPTLEPGSAAPPKEVAADQQAEPASPPQQPAAQPGVPPETPAGGEDVAGMPQPPQPEASPPAEAEPAATPVAWVNDYGGGTCFYAAASDTPGSTFIEGFATSAAPFEAMVAEFKTIYDAEPGLSVQLIEPKQCAVAEFLQAIRKSPAERPELTLSSDLIESGQALRGTLANIEGRTTDVLLVDNAGVVYNLAAHLKQEPERASFNIKLGLQTDEPVPQIIIALTSPNGLETAKVETPVLAETLFPEILDEIDDGKIAASATARYFRLGG
jgi:serine/threonine protein kinase